MSRLKKQASILEEFGHDYVNKEELVTPYHILFKDFGNDIASLDEEAAIQYCISKIDELNEHYREDESYYYISDEEKNELLESFHSDGNDSGMDILFTIKDYLLKTEGLEVNSSRLKKK